MVDSDAIIADFSSGTLKVLDYINPNHAFSALDTNKGGTNDVVAFAGKYLKRYHTNSRKHTRRKNASEMGQELRYQRP